MTNRVVPIISKFHEFLMISFLMKTPLPSSKVDTIFGFFCFPFLCRFFCFIVSSADFGKESIPFVFSIRISFFYRLDELPALAFCFILFVCFLVILSSMLDDDDEGVPRPRQRNVVTDGTLLRRQELPRAAQLVATDDYFFLIVAEIYSPSKFYWFLKDQRRAIETVGVSVWLCTRAGATPISFFFPPLFCFRTFQVAANDSTSSVGCCCCCCRLCGRCVEFDGSFFFWLWQRSCRTT